MDMRSNSSFSPIRFDLSMSTNVLRRETVRVCLHLRDRSQPRNRSITLAIQVFDQSQPQRLTCHAAGLQRLRKLHEWIFCRLVIAQIDLPFLQQVAEDVTRKVTFTDQADSR